VVIALVDNKATIGSAELEEGGELEKGEGSNMEKEKEEEEKRRREEGRTVDYTYESCVPWAWFQQCHEAGTFSKVSQTVTSHPYHTTVVTVFNFFHYAPT